jgi:hypothetical protein
MHPLRRRADDAHISVHRESHAEAHNRAPRPYPTTLSPASVPHLQRLAGNRAMATILQRDEHDSRQAGGCSCNGGGKCSCPHPVQRHVSGHDAGLDWQVETVQRSKTGPAAQPVDYSKTHTCGLGEGARIFSSWSFATAKLMENLPAMELSWLTGKATNNLKRNLKKNFNVDEDDKAQRQRVLGKLIRGYNKILGVMGAGLVAVRCGGPECEHGDFAYIWPDDKDKVIYLCDVQFAKETSILDLGCMWVHELSHKRLGTDDHGYFSAGESTTLDTDTALDNADCWGNFMVTYT